MALAVPLKRASRQKSAVFDPEIDRVISQRDGDVLGKGTIVKADLVQDEFSSHSAYRISGCPNFRRVEKYCISGLSQPTVFGIRTALNRLIGHRERKRVSIIWVNLREEPIVYINSRPFTLREIDNPTHNFSFKGTTLGNMVRLENTLKADILREARANCYNILLHDELNRYLNPIWEAVDASAVSTTAEIFAGLREQEGYRVTHARLPVPPESMMPEASVDALIALLKSSLHDGDTEFVFNCQMGRGRSTLGMVLTCLLSMWHRVLRDLRDNTADLTGFSRTEAVRDTLGKFLDGPWRRVHPVETADGLRPRRSGQYSLILRLVNMLPYGQLVKDQADVAIDTCSAILNLREDVANLWSMSEQAQTSQEREIYVHRAQSYFKRYFHVILFNGYIASQMTQTAAEPFAVPYSEWIADRNEIRVLQEKLEGNPDSVLKLKLGPLPGWRGGSPYDPNLYEARTIHERAGDVLSSGRILKVDYWVGRGVSTLGGVPNYRVVMDKYNSTKVVGLGQSTASGIRNVLVRIAESRSDPSEAVPVYWFNLREEPILYLGDVPYVLRERAHWNGNISLYQGIDPERLEQAEVRLKRDVLAEARARHGFFTVHDETEAGGIVSETLRLASSAEEEELSARLVTEEDGEEVLAYLAVQTEKEVFDQMNRVGGVALHYRRVPVTSRRAPEIRDYQDILEAIATAPPTAHIVFHTQTGGLRCTTAMVAALLILYWRGVTAMGGARLHTADFQRNTYLSSGAEGGGVAPLASPLKRSLGKKPRRGEYRVIMEIVQTLHEGQLVKAQVDDVIDRCSSVLNLHKAGKWATGGLSADAESSDAGHLQRRASKALRMDALEAQQQLFFLENYFSLIILNSYLAEMALTHRLSPRISSAGPSPSTFASPPQTFSGWHAGKPELLTVWASALADPVKAVRRRSLHGKKSSEDEDAVIARRSGNVLVTQTILKHDHFPGLQRKGLHPRIPGCANYRKVAGLPVYGCAQPTGDGIMNALEYLQQSLAGGMASSASFSSLAELEGDAVTPDSDDERRRTGRVVRYFWTNMREEPVIYVNSRPFVVRRRDDPFQNMEITGISAERVEGMEDRLKHDILRDAGRYGSRVLLHDELPDGRIYASWEAVTPDSVLTLKEMYMRVAAQGYAQVDYCRIPITDEKAPETVAFESLVQRLQGAKPHDQIIFNCQMGRGRTTTGMIIACLHHSIITAGPERHPFSLEGAVSVPAASELLRYHRGEFRIILRLVRVVKDGKAIKATCDAIIDRCSAMQNLRVAIADLKAKAVVHHDDKTLAKITHVGINYLSRYFYLIAFASYLRDQSGNPEHDDAEAFGKWLERNADIVALLEDIAFV